MSLKNFLGISAAVIASVGYCLYMGSFVGKGIYAPKSVYVKDLNEDGRPDLIVKTVYDHKFIFLQQYDGSYQTLDQILAQINEQSQEEIRGLTEQLRGTTEQLRSTIEANIKDIE